MNVDKCLKKNNLFIKQFRNGIARILILWIISCKKIHGYGISIELNNFFNVFNDEEDSFNPAKIYPILKRMEEKELVKSEEGLSNNKKVKFHTITPKGLDFLNFIKTRWIKILQHESWNEFFNDMTNSKI